MKNILVHRLLRMRDLKIPADRRGFTFLEVLAALAILSIALVPIMTWVPSSIQAKRKASQQTTAIFLAQSKIEELHRDILNNFDFDYNVNNTAFSAPYQKFRYRVNDNLKPNLKTIKVRVWHVENPKGKIIFDTRVARR